MPPGRSKSRQHFGHSSTRLEPPLSRGRRRFALSSQPQRIGGGIFYPHRQFANLSEFKTYPRASPAIAVTPATIADHFEPHEFREIERGTAPHASPADSSRPKKQPPPGGFRFVLAAFATGSRGVRRTISDRMGAEELDGADPGRGRAHPRHKLAGAWQRLRSLRQASLSGNGAVKGTVSLRCGINCIVRSMPCGQGSAPDNPPSSTPGS